MASMRVQHLVVVLAIAFCSKALAASRPVIVNAVEPEAVADSWKSPWFCHALDCPPYKTLQEDVVDDVDLRSYEPSIWISTNVSDVNWDTAQRTGFLRLFEYISGANEHGWKIDMTSPVRTLLVAGEGPFCEDFFTVSFYMPREYQEGKKRPPQPNRDTVFIERTPAASYYVLGYGGFTSEGKILDKVTDMLGRLDEVDAQYDASVFMSAGYDPPFRLINRHNEIWIPAKDSAVRKVAPGRAGGSEKGL